MVVADESPVVDCVTALSASPDLPVPGTASKRACGKRSQGVRKHVATGHVLWSVSEGLTPSSCAVSVSLVSSSGLQGAFQEVGEQTEASKEEESAGPTCGLGSRSLSD